MSIFATRPPGTQPRLQQRTDARELRSSAEIEAQHHAAEAFAGDVAAMQTTSHRYTAGQAATLAWLMDAGPPPLTFGATAPGRPSASDVQRLQDRTRELLEANDGDGSAVFPRAYVMGVDYVCRWARRRTDLPPIPASPNGRSDSSSAGVA